MTGWGGFGGVWGRNDNVVNMDSGNFWKIRYGAAAGRLKTGSK
jgi:hypothetical protein